MLSRIPIIRPRRLLALLIVLVPTSVLAREQHVSEGEADPRPTVSEVVQQILDVDGLVAHRQAWNLFSKLTAGERDVALRQLVISDNESAAASAARALIHNGASDVSDLISTQITTWSDTAQQQVLAIIISEHRQVALRDIPRQVLRGIVEQGGPGPRLDPMFSAADTAARLISDTGEDGDKALLRAAIEVFPQSHGLWRALLEADALEEPQELLAIMVYPDPGQSVLMRTWAAAAIASMDERAMRFVSDQIEELLSTFGRSTMEDLVSNLQSDDPERKQRYMDFRARWRSISVLSMLPEPAGRELTLAAMDAVNQPIRSTAGVIAARRWPDVILARAEVSKGVQEYQNLLALLTIYHPTYVDKVQAIVPRSRLDAARDKLQAEPLLASFPLADTSVIRVGAP